MNIDDLTIKEVKHIQSLLKGGEASQSPYKIGEKYFIRTVTHYYTGLLTRVTPRELVLREAAWIADSGRFMDAIEKGSLNEVEPFPADEDVIIGRGSVIDSVRWKHVLPRAQK